MIMDRDSGALASLTATYTDSDVSDDETNEEDGEEQISAVIVTPVNLVQNVEENLNINDEIPDPVINLSQTIQNMSPDDIQLPPEPPGRCSAILQDKVVRLIQRKQNLGYDMNQVIQKNKEFRNPSIYEKLISFVGIDEFGTNYQPEIYDPHSWKEESFYEELAKAQKLEMEKRQKEKTKVEFISGTAKKNSSTTEPTSDESKKRKSKWDIGAAQPPLKNQQSILGQPAGIIPIPVNPPKTTFISAYGTIGKKAKP